MNMRSHSHMVLFLLWLGFVRRDASGTLRWPFKGPPGYVFESWRSFVGYCRFWGGPYIFRNLPHVTRDVPGSLMPRRWGVGLWGFEFGHRG
jgi:hypothetical protein